MQALWYTHQSASTGRHKNCGRCHHEAHRSARIGPQRAYSSRSSRAPSACQKPRRQPMIESTAKVARLEDATGTSLDDHLPRAPVVSDWQRRDGGGATRVRRCPEGDSGSQRPLNRAPSADEMTASLRRTRWRHRREPATRACGAHGKFEGFASGEPRRHEFVHS